MATSARLDMNKNISVNRWAEDRAALEMVSQRVWDFFVDSAKKHGFEEREGQQDMALDIADAIRDMEHILVEAGVGIGKSFAYIVPLLYYHQLFRKSIVIATSTITLQEQLAGDIATISKKLQYSPQVVLAKGQSHFVCKRRAVDHLAGRDDKVSSRIARLLDEGYYDRKDYPDIDQHVWIRINIKDFRRRDCERCKYKSECHFLQLRERMLSSAGIIICNQDLLTVHLRNIVGEGRPLLNPSTAVVVIDEAHNLEEKVRYSLTHRYRVHHIADAATVASRAIRDKATGIDESLNKLLKSLDSVFELFNNHVEEQIRVDPPNMQYAERFTISMGDDLMRRLKRLYKQLSRVNEITGIHVAFGGEDVAAAEDRLSDITWFVEQLVGGSDNMLFWLERPGDNMSDLQVCGCPKDLAREIQNLYFDNRFTTILTSATITNQKVGKDEDKYAYFLKNTGFPGIERRGFLSPPKPSPFPYDKHAMLYYCSDLPHPTDYREEFLRQGVKTVVKLLDISKGKALVLFTAKSDLTVAHDLLLQERLPYTILTQRTGFSQDGILETFRKDTNSVLLGTGAYWEGINIEGASLSNLIIFRLPFPVPDPIINYKSSISADSLMEVSVPEMIIKLNQGIGRLIRSSTDKGIVSIIDPRLGHMFKAPYRDLVWKSIPIRNITDDLDTLSYFYSNTTK